MITHPGSALRFASILTLFMLVLTSRVSYAQEDSSRAVRKLALVAPVISSGMVTSGSSLSVGDSLIQWSDYTFSGDLLKQIPGSYLADMNQPGDPSEMLFDGLGSGYNKYLLDGVEMNEPVTSSMNLYHVPMEFMRGYQYIDAVRAPIYQFNANGALINFESTAYSEAVPYSNVRHLEEPYNYLITDAIFSQNIGLKSNLDFGVERQTTDGRFVNSVYDGVNVRAKYRYSIDSIRQITFTELYYRTKGGMTGGAMPYSVGAGTFAQYGIDVRSQYANLTYLQHHLQAAYTQTSPDDSTSFVTLSAYYDYYNFEFGDGSLPYYLTNISSRTGANVRSSLDLFGGRLNGGAEAVSEAVSSNNHTSLQPVSRFSAYADQEYEMFDFIRFGIFGRGDLLRDKFYPALGGSFGFLTNGIDVEIAASISHHVPSMSDEYFVSQDFVGNPNLNAETDRIYELTLSTPASDDFTVSLKPYARIISDPIYFQTKYVGQPEYPSISVTNLNSRRIYGCDFNVRFSFWKFVADGMVNYVDEKVDGSGALTLPKYFASGELYLHDIFFDGHLNLKVGIRGKFLTSFMGNEFYPEALVYYPASINEFGPAGSSDIFVQGKVGDAIVYLTFYNITNQQYFVTPVYPVLDFSFAFGVNWNFLN